MNKLNRLYTLDSILLLMEYEQSSFLSNARGLLGKLKKDIFFIKMLFWSFGSFQSMNILIICFSEHLCLEVLNGTWNIIPFRLILFNLRNLLIKPDSTWSSAGYVRHLQAMAEVCTYSIMPIIFTLENIIFCVIDYPYHFSYSFLLSTTYFI